MKQENLDQLKAIQDRLSAVSNELNTVMSGIEREEPKEGEWIWVKEHESNRRALVCCKGKNKDFFGFNYLWEWTNHFGWPMTLIDCEWHYASPSEVQKALTDHWEGKLGAVKGCRFKSAYKGMICEYDGTTKISPNGDFDNDEGTIFDIKKCQWATIIPEKNYGGG